MSDEGFIGLPPGMTPPVDSGTLRRDRPERTRAERDEITFFPAGAAPAPVVDVPVVDVPVVDVPVADAPVVDAPPADAPEEQDSGETRISVRRHAGGAWRLMVPGQSHPVVVDGTLFLGRNPSPAPGVTGVILAVDDPAKSVSKTHAILEPDAEGLWVHDLDSTNGVWVVPEGEDPVEVIPGTRAAVPAGADLELGDFVIQVERG